MSKDKRVRLEKILGYKGLQVPDFEVDSEISKMAKEGAIAYVSSSGGKDSQDLFLKIRDIFPKEQIVVVHANLGEVEWEGIVDHIKNNIDDHTLNIVESKNNFLSTVERRGMWPSPAQRWCTSDLKQSPIFKFIRNDMERRGVTKSLNAMGIRAEESSNRARKARLSVNSTLTYLDVDKRLVFDWNPILKHSEIEVFQNIGAAGQKPFWAYERNERISCSFCIMGSASDLKHAAEVNPELYDRYVATEIAVGHTMFMVTRKGVMVPVPLTQKTGVKPNWKNVKRLVEEIRNRLSPDVLEKALKVTDGMEFKPETPQLALF